MTRIVLDTNILGRGHFNLHRLQSVLESVAGSGVEVVVPEVVVWEWAEHAAATYEALVEEHRAFRVDESLYRLPDMPPVLPKQELVAAILKAIPRDVTVWRPQGEEWRAAIEAQVLQTGTGERKGGVKTGAADHLLLACVREQLDERGSAEAVVLATGDRNLRQACEAALDDEVLYADNERELLRRLIEFEPAPEELSEAVEEELSSRIKHGNSDIGETLQTFAMGFEVVGRREPLKNTQRELARLGRVDIVELHELEVGQFEQGARRIRPGAALRRRSHDGAGADEARRRLRR